MKSLSVRPLILCVQVVISTFPQARKISGWCPCSSASSPTRFTNPRALRKSGNLNVFLRWCSSITFHPSTCFCREESSSPFSGGTPPRHGTQALAARSDITTVILAAACMKCPRRFPAPLRQPRSLNQPLRDATSHVRFPRLHAHLRTQPEREVHSETPKIAAYTNRGPYPMVAGHRGWGDASLRTRSLAKERVRPPHINAAVSTRTIMNANRGRSVCCWNLVLFRWDVAVQLAQISLTWCGSLMRAASTID